MIKALMHEKEITIWMNVTHAQSCETGKHMAIIHLIVRLLLTLQEQNASISVDSTQLQTPFNHCATAKLNKNSYCCSV